MSGSIAYVSGKETRKIGCLKLDKWQRFTQVHSAALQPQPRHAVVKDLSDRATRTGIATAAPITLEGILMKAHALHFGDDIEEPRIEMHSLVPWNTVLDVWLIPGHEYFAMPISSDKFTYSTLLLQSVQNATGVFERVATAAHYYGLPVDGGPGCIEDTWHQSFFSLLEPQVGVELYPCLNYSHESKRHTVKLV